MAAGVFYYVNSSIMKGDKAMASIPLELSWSFYLHQEKFRNFKPTPTKHYEMSASSIYTSYSVRNYTAGSPAFFVHIKA